MSVEESIFATLSGNAALGALVGDRIYPGLAVLPGDASKPYVVWEMLPMPTSPTHGEAVGVNRLRLFQFSCFAPTYAGAVAISAAVEAALDGVAIGTSGNATLQDDRDLGHDAAANLYGRSLDFMI